MVNAALKLFDYLIKAREHRKINKKLYFERHVEPIFQASEIVFKDYLEILNNLKRKVEGGTDIKDIIIFLEDSRIKNIDVRIKIRAFLKTRSDVNGIMDENGYIDRRGLSKFESGIWGLLLSGIGDFEDNARVNWINPYGRDGHTLLDFLYDLSSDFYKEHKDRHYISKVSWRIEVLTRAWKDVVEGYGEQQVEAIPKV